MARQALAAAPLSQTPEAVPMVATVAVYLRWQAHDEFADSQNSSAAVRHLPA
jgi:hypothetical protein